MLGLKSCEARRVHGGFLIALDTLAAAWQIVVVLYAGIAQLAEREICNFVVVGSIPTAGSPQHFSMQTVRKKAYQNRLSAVRLLRNTLLSASKEASIS